MDYWKIEDSLNKTWIMYTYKILLYFITKIYFPKLSLSINRRHFLKSLFNFFENLSLAFLNKYMHFHFDQTQQ